MLTVVSGLTEQCYREVFLNDLSSKIRPKFDRNCDIDGDGDDDDDDHVVAVFFVQTLILV